MQFSPGSVTLDNLWSPWRMEYIQSKKEASCIFCGSLDQQDGPENLIVHRGQRGFVILNRYPYTSGHLMVVPFEHCSSLDVLDEVTRTDIMELSVKAIQVLKIVYRPQGYNMGMNLGEAAGAGIAEHVHMHIVPRWEGDTNFMSALANTRVLPETLADTYQRVLTGWRQLFTPHTEQE